MNQIHRISVTLALGLSLGLAAAPLAAAEQAAKTVQLPSKDLDKKFLIAVAPMNRDASVKIVAEIDEIPDAIAAAELEGNIKHLSSDGAFTKEWMERALEMARLIGMTDLAPVDQIYIETFKPVPTRA